jgi:hypothetical protein
MTSKKAKRWPGLLLLAAGFSLATIAAAGAQAPSAAEPAEAAEEGAPSLDINDVDMTEIDPDSIDWSQLNVDASTLSLTAPKVRTGAKTTAGNDMSWSANARPNGASAVSVKQSLTPFWDTRIGADMTVVSPSASTSADVLRQKFSPDAPPSQSSGTAWAAATAPGVGSIWDKTSIEARVDPGQEQGKLGTSLTKSVPLNEQYSLTLQNGYNVIQQGIMPVPGIASHPATRNYETDQSAKLSITDTGTSFVAGQSLSTTDDRWLRKFGAEQKLFDGVTISGSVGETAAGTTNKSISAGFKKSW